MDGGEDEGDAPPDDDDDDDYGGIGVVAIDQQRNGEKTIDLAPWG